MPGPLPGLTESAPWSRAQCLISTTSIDEVHPSEARAFPIHPTTPEGREWRLLLMVNLRQSGIAWEGSPNEGLSTWGWLVSISVGDDLDCSNWSGKIYPLWVVPFPGPETPTALEWRKRAKQALASLHEFRALCWLCEWYNQVLRVPASLVSLQRWSVNLELWAK